MQLADALAALLPRDQARRSASELGDLGVRVIRMGTVPDQMLFDKDRIVVQAGKPVEIVFENTDLMPHNFVVTGPAHSKRSASLAEETATQPGALERQYVPRSNKVLLASRLLQPRESEKLDFTAPGEPGVYPYVCTYPGHWRRMYGALYVVDDLDEYLADPEAYLQAHPLPVADELLKFNRPRKEWKLDDLAAAVEQLQGGPVVRQRQADVPGRHLRLLPQAQRRRREFGPDLTKLDPKMTPLDVLKNILEPSLKIDDKYRTYVFETESGKVVTGMILEETRRRGEGDREPAGDGGAGGPAEVGDHRPHQVADVDHAEGAARQADPRRDPRPGGLRDRPGRRPEPGLPLGAGGGDGHQAGVEGHGDVDEKKRPTTRLVRARAPRTYRSPSSALSATRPISHDRPPPPSFFPPFPVPTADNPSEASCVIALPGTTPPPGRRGARSRPGNRDRREPAPPHRRPGRGTPSGGRGPGGSRSRWARWSRVDHLAVVGPVHPVHPTDGAGAGLAVRAVPRRDDVAVAHSYPVRAVAAVAILPGLIRYVPAQYPHHYIDLSGTFGGYLDKFSSKSRWTLRKKSAGSPSSPAARSTGGASARRDG